MTKAPVGPASPEWPFSPALPSLGLPLIPPSSGGGVPDTGGAGMGAVIESGFGSVRELVREMALELVCRPGDVPKKRAEKVTFEQVLRLILAERRREGNLRTGTTLDLS